MKNVNEVNKGNSNLEKSKLLDNLFMDKIESEKSNNGNIKNIIRNSFDNNIEKYLVVKLVAEEFNYSNVRINNIFRELLEEKYISRIMIKGRYYYKRSL